MRLFLTHESIQRITQNNFFEIIRKRISNFWLYFFLMITFTQEFIRFVVQALAGTERLHSTAGCTSNVAIERPH
jgi:TRAP-type C4-dicarboxylate transport system permease small subunit